MAEQTAAKGSANGKHSQPEDDRAPTKRVILKRERVIVLPEEIDATHAEPLLETVRKKVGENSKAVLADAWIIVTEQEGSTMRAAIEAHAGKPGTPDAKPGVWKAPTVGAFSGGRVYERPPQPKIEGADLDD